MGGNIFKDSDGTMLTKRIDRSDVASTVKWLEKITKLPLLDNMIGTTGRAKTSGDIDLAVDANQIEKQELVDILSKYAEKQKRDPASMVKKSGINVHFKTPINGDPANGFVQTDFMFGEPTWMKWSMQGGQDQSQYKGAHRHIILASIAKSKGMRWSFQNGLVDRETNQVITQEPNEIAKKLLGQTATPKQLDTADAIIDYIIKLPNYEEMVADARQTLSRDGIELPHANTIGSVKEGSIGWFRAIIEAVK